MSELERTSLAENPTLTDENERQEPQERPVSPRSKAFQEAVKRIYGYACAACGLRAFSPKGRPEVEAAHIFPKSERGSDDFRNGVCLCRFHHWAFDAGWFAMRDDLTIVVRSDLPREHDFDAIRQLQQRAVTMPSDARLRPHPIYLAARRKLHAFE